VLDIRAAREICSTRLTEGLISPYNTIKELSHYASTLVFSQPHPAKIVLSDDIQTISVNGKPLHIYAWREGLQKLHNDVEARILKVMKGSPIPFEIPDDIQDDMTDTRRGHSWLQHGCFTKEPNPLFQRYLDDPEEKLAYIGPDDKFHVQSGRALEVMEDMEFINIGLCCLHNQVNAQAYRGTSLSDLRLRNSYRLRNHNRHHGRSRHILQCTKTTNTHDKDIFLPILIARRLQRLDDMYLVILRPMEEILAYALWGKTSWKLYREFMFVQMGQRLTENKLYRQFPEMCKKYCGVELSLSDYRDWAIAVMREYIAPEYLPDRHRDTVGDKMGQHSTMTARGTYAPVEGGLPYLTTDAMWFYDQFCEEWQNVSGFGLRGLPIPIKLRNAQATSTASVTTASVTTANASCNDSTLSANGNIIQMFQTLIDKVTDVETKLHSLDSNMVKRLGDLKREVRDDTQKLLAQGLAVLRESQPGPSTASSFFGMEDDVMTTASTASVNFCTGDSSNDDSAPMDTSTHLSTAINPSTEAPAVSQDAYSAYFDDDLYLPEQEEKKIVVEEKGDETEQTALMTLRTALGNPEAIWRSDEQRETVLAALALQCNVVSVMKTGAGKSMAWIIPALMQSNIKTVVAVPYARLLEQHLANSIKMNCRAMRWTTKSGSIGDANLIFVALETAAAVPFKR
jgi:hypothetical protein